MGTEDSIGSVALMILSRNIGCLLVYPSLFYSSSPSTSSASVSVPCCSPSSAPAAARSSWAVITSSHSAATSYTRSNSRHGVASRGQTDLHVLVCYLSVDTRQWHPGDPATVDRHTAIFGSCLSFDVSSLILERKSWKEGENVIAE